MKLYGIAGWKNSGKTGLVTRLVTHFTAKGLKVSTLKHAHHAFDVDEPGRDSYRHREAGAAEVALVSSRRIAIMTELRGAEEPTMEEALARMAPADLILIEGYKSGPHPKIEAHRAANNRALLATETPSVRAIASDTPTLEAAVPVLPLDDTEAIAAFIARDLGMDV